MAFNSVSGSLNSQNNLYQVFKSSSRQATCRFELSMKKRTSIPNLVKIRGGQIFCQKMPRVTPLKLFGGQRSTFSDGPQIL